MNNYIVTWETEPSTGVIKHTLVIPAVVLEEVYKRFQKWYVEQKRMLPAENLEVSLCKYPVEGESRSVVRISNLTLLHLCQRENWFDGGTIEQYGKLLFACEIGAPIEELAAMIWLCSDNDDSRREIRNKIIETVLEGEKSYD